VFNAFLFVNSQFFVTHHRKRWASNL